VFAVGWAIKNPPNVGLWRAQRYGNFAVLKPALEVQNLFFHVPEMRKLLILFLLIVGPSLWAQETQKRPLSLHGTAAVNIGFFREQGYLGSQPRFFWSLTGNPVLGLYGHPVPVNLMVSNQQRSLSGPFSQLGCSPTFRWAKFHAGVRGLNFSPFSVAGHTFLGAAVEINPGAFRFGVLGGRFQKAREADTSSAFQLRPAYRRMGYGIKLGVGKKRNYFDLIFFKAKDDSTSLRSIAREVGSVTPDENIVLGTTTLFSFGKHISFKMDGGASLYTRDIRTALLVDEIGDAKIKTLSASLGQAFPLHISTSLAFAGESILQFQGKSFQIGLNYRRVEPEYASMGAWFFQTDIQQVTVNPSFNFKKRKARLLLNGGWQTDNLLDLKPATSQRWIGGGSLSINPTERFGLDLQANNFQFTQENRYLATDSLRLQQSTLFLSASPHWQLVKGGVTRLLNAVLTYQKSNDYNPYTRQGLQSNFLFGQVMWNRSATKAGLNTGFGLNARLNKNGTAAEDQSLGLVASASKAVLKKTVQLRTNLNYNLNFLGQKLSGNSFGGGGGISWKLHKSTQFNTNIYFLTSHSRQRDFRFLTVSSGLEYSF
jgi:hypothetical protein